MRVPAAERVRPRVLRELRQEPRLRLLREREVVNERTQLVGRRPGRKRLVRDVGEDDEAEPAAAVGQVGERRADARVGVGGDARGEIEHDDAVGPGRHELAPAQVGLPARGRRCEHERDECHGCERSLGRRATTERDAVTRRRQAGVTGCSRSQPRARSARQAPVPRPAPVAPPTTRVALASGPTAPSRIRASRPAARLPRLYVARAAELRQRSPQRVGRSRAAPAANAERLDRDQRRRRREQQTGADRKRRTRADPVPFARRLHGGRSSTANAGVARERRGRRPAARPRAAATGRRVATHAHRSCER